MKRKVTILMFGMMIAMATLARASGQLYVADWDGNAVHKFDVQSGRLLSTIRSGIKGPAMMAFDPEGMLYVLNYGEKRFDIEREKTVSKYDLSDRHISTIILDSKLPQSIAFDQAGLLCVLGLNFPKTAIDKYDRSGVKVASIEGEFAMNNRMAIDSEGVYYLTDMQGKTINKYDSNGKSLGKFPCDLKNPANLVIDPAGYFYIFDFSDRNIVKFDREGKRIKVFSGANHLPTFAVDSVCNVFTINSSKEIVRYDAAGKPNVFILPSLNSPSDLKIDSQGVIHVANMGSTNIARYDREGDFLSLMDLHGKRPTAIAFDKAGQLVVANAEDGTIDTYDSNEKVIATIKTNRKSTMGLVFDNQGNLFASHPDDVYDPKPGKATIEKYSPSGKRVQTIVGHLVAPHGLAIDSDQNLYVANMGQRIEPPGQTPSIAKFDASGRFVSAITTNLKQPKALALDKLGDLYVTDGSVGTVLKFTRDGKFLDSFTAEPMRPTTGVSRIPNGMSFDSQGHLFVANGEGSITHYDAIGKLLSVTRGTIDFNMFMIVRPAIAPKALP